MQCTELHFGEVDAYVVSCGVEHIGVGCRCVVIDCGKFYHPRCISTPDIGGLTSDHMETQAFIWQAPPLTPLATLRFACQGGQLRFIINRVEPPKP